MRIEPAHPDDIAALHALIESAYRGDSARRGWTHEADLLGGQRTDKAALAAIFADPRQVMLVSRTGSEARRINGCVQLARQRKDCAYLGMLTVDPEHQAGGLGKRLLLASEAYVEDQWQAPAIEMTVIGQRADLIAYYERRGYARTGETRPFPMDDPRYGLPKTEALEFVVLRKALS